MRRALFLIGLSVAGAYLLRRYLFETVSVASGSMEPTLSLGVHYIVNELAYRFHGPQRGDIIVFESPLDSSKGLIKRVVAIEGDEVELRDKQVFLNGQPLSEPYTIHKRSYERLVGDTIAAMKVPPGHVFVLGDNRDESEDSSVWKDPKTGEHIFFVPHAAIKGKLVKL